MSSRKKKKIGTVDILIYVPVFIGSYAVLSCIKVFELATKCVRFSLALISFAGKRGHKLVQVTLAKVSKLTTKLVGLFKKVFVLCLEMPNKYAFKLKQVYAKFSIEHARPVESEPKTKYTRKSYRHTPAVKASKLASVLSSIKLFAGGSLFSLVFIALPVSAYSWYRGLPQPDLLVENAQANRPTKILDRNGQPLYEIYVDKKYAPVALEKIPKHTILATLAVEDHEFFDHSGVRPLSILRAAKATIIDDQMQGGSTITQQLIKNVLLTPERTITRKLKELFLAYAVEQRYTKDEILGLYLNNIPYGGVAWGIESAAQKLFAKDVWDLTLGESAFLASLPSSPSAYVSYASNSEAAKRRQSAVLNRMEELGIITSAQNAEALAEGLNFAPQHEYIKAPHFVSYVRKELESRYGNRMVEYGGLTVKTSLDLDLQTKLEEVVKTEVAKDLYLNITNGAVVVLDPRTGEILAYVGSVDYFKEGWGAYDVITAQRQPGSTIKVVTYALAFEKGKTAADTVVDGPLTIQLGGGKTYSPVNYDGRYHGAVSLRSALANSYNIPAVKLVKDFGPDNMVALGNKLGLAGWEVNDTYGYAVTLGGKETRLLDLTNVYATFARGGMYRPTTPFISIKDSNGFNLYDDSRIVEYRAISEETAYILTNILSDSWARAPAFGSRSALYIPGHTVAAKTGTTNDKRDNYTVGYTLAYTVGVWVGNNDNSPMNPYLASGVDGAAPIWNKTMHILLDGREAENFPVPSGIFTKTDNKCGRSEVFTRGSQVPNLCPEPDKDKEKNEAKHKDKD